MSKFETIISFIISLLQCFVPRKWKKKKPTCPPTIPPVEVPSGQLAPPPDAVVAYPRPDGSDPCVPRGDSLTRAVGYCLIAVGGVGSLYRLFVG